ncbi:MAG: hypothetical protein BMS9Abin33_1276 [Gammaproteobacteria bacterium]|nr:MAG: hypothetical protein BMS9Abin33_1276 [Gammaproteobacteria bacterium]
MPGDSTEPVPTDITLHRNTRILEVTFSDGADFRFSCEYLRVFSPSAEVKVLANRGEVVTGKQDVNINQITPMGNYAIKIDFDDGHDTGIYSWPTLYELGKDQDKNWAAYEQKVIDNRSSEIQSGPVSVHILYFVNLPDELGIDNETSELPDSVTTVNNLVEWLKARGEVWEKALGQYPLKITVNKQFVETDFLLKHNDEIAIVPVPPSLTG